MEEILGLRAFPCVFWDIVYFRVARFVLLTPVDSVVNELLRICSAAAAFSPCLVAAVFWTVSAYGKNE
jgi:hypothetical protein